MQYIGKCMLKICKTGTIRFKMSLETSLCKQTNLVQHPEAEEVVCFCWQFIMPKVIYIRCFFSSNRLCMQYIGKCTSKICKTGTIRFQMSLETSLCKQTKLVHRPEAEEVVCFCWQFIMPKVIYIRCFFPSNRLCMQYIGKCISKICKTGTIRFQMSLENSLCKQTKLVQRPEAEEVVCFCWQFIMPKVRYIRCFFHQTDFVCST